MKKISNISLMVVSIALAGLWSCNKAQSFANTASELPSVTSNSVELTSPGIVGADHYDITRDEDYHEYLAVYRPWSSKTMMP